MSLKMLYKYNVQFKITTFGFIIQVLVIYLQHHKYTNNKKLTCFMKNILLFFTLSAICITFSSCLNSEKDLYDPSFQTNNPIASDFSAPQDFNWSSVSTRTVSIDVDDEFNGQYDYLVEVLDANPFTTSEFNVLAKGVAKKNAPFVKQIVYTSNLVNLYVRETDPRGRVSIKVISLSEIVKPAATSKSVTRSVSTRAATAPEEYKEETYDTSGAIQLVGSANWNQYDNHIEGGKKYIVKANTIFNGQITSNYVNYGDHFTLFVEGEWIPQNNIQLQKANIIVLNGGKINSSANNDFLVAENSSLTIQTGGTVIAKNINMATEVLVKNFGNILANSMTTINTGSKLYNAKKATITLDGNNVNSWEHTLFAMGSVNNFGTITISKGEFKTNSFDQGYLFYNGIGAQISTPTFAVGAIGLNEGTIRTARFTNQGGGNPDFTNNCNLFISDSFDFSSTSGSITLNKGIIAGGITNNEFTAVPNFICGNSGCTLNLNNGSMIKAKIIKVPGAVINGGTSTRSLLKATESITTGWITDFKGNLDIECPIEQFALGSSIYFPNYTMGNNVELYAPNGSKNIIASCSETVEVPDPGTNPANPTFPIVVDNNQNYTYIFEDQWPLYGDYDMNDIVMTIKRRYLSIDWNDKVIQFDMDVALNAVGATKNISAAVMFDDIPASAITSKVTVTGSDDWKSVFNVTDKNIENNQNKTVVPLFANAHKLMGKLSYKYINTEKNSSQNTTNVPVIRISMKFNNPTLNLDAFNINKLNLFIITDKGEKRKEIHIAGYAPSDLANTQLFGGNNDGSTNGRYYVSKENLAWGIMVPTNFKWPVEYVNIKNAYKTFLNWVQSGGANDKTWWDSFDTSKVF